MNNKNKILVACLALLLVLSVGYALFSETVTINGTATAKGDFEISVLEADTSDDGIKMMMLMMSEGGENPSFQINENIVTTNVTLTRPGMGHDFAIEFKNTGSIPAKLKSIKDITNNIVILDKNTNAAGGGGYVYSAGTDENTVEVTLLTENGYYDDYIYSKDDLVRFADDFTDPEALLSAVLDPGESIYFIIHYVWAPSSITPGDDINLSWNVQFNFEQVTAN